MNEELKEQEFDNAKIIDEVKAFINSRESYFQIDKTEFIRSQNLQAGNGWFERLGRAWGEARSNLTINPLKAVVDSTINNFIRNPFKFTGIGENDNQKINDVLVECLRDACNDGLGYFYVYHVDNGELCYKSLSNQGVIYTEHEALVIDKRKGDRNSKKTSIWSNTEVLALAADEVPILTYFKKEGKEITVTQIENEYVIAQTTLQLPHIPIVQIRNKAVKLKHETHWRGYYFEFQDTVALMNALLSKSAEIAIARTPVALTEESLSGNEEYIEQWQSNEPRNLYVYKGFKTFNNNGIVETVALPGPTFAPNSQDLETMQNQITALKNYIDSGTGSNLTSETVGNETATSVMLRRESKQAALSEMLKNLQTAAFRITKIISSYAFILNPELGQELEITIIDQFDNSIRNQRALDMIMSMHQMQIAPQLQVTMLDLFGAPQEIIQSMQNIMQNSEDPEKMEMQQQIEQLNMQLQYEQLRAKEAEAIVASAKLEAEQRYSTKMAELEMNAQIKQAEFALEHEKLKLEYAKLGLSNKNIATEMAEEQKQNRIDNALKAIEILA